MLPYGAAVVAEERDTSDYPLRADELAVLDRELAAIESAHTDEARSNADRCGVAINAKRCEVAIDEPAPEAEPANEDAAEPTSVADIDIRYFIRSIDAALNRLDELMIGDTPSFEELLALRGQVARR
jgi:hypothetical protein